jgi:chemotaxis signal transduction protein
MTTRSGGSPPEPTRARELRDAFDRDFAAAPRPLGPSLGEYLCVRIAGEPSAISVAEIASLHADLAIVALPTHAPELLGIAAIRAAIVPIYDLAAAVGLAATGATRWAVLVRGDTAGFAFEGYEGHARIHAGAIAASAQPGSQRGRSVVDGLSRSIIDLGAALAAIENRWRRTGATKEP